MNKIWLFIMLVASLILLFVNPQAIFTEMTSASMGVINLCIELFALYSIWLGILEIADKSGLSALIAKALSPLIRYLFNITDPETTKMIAMNISSNLLGIGNAATPCGIKAMKLMDDGSGKISPAMIMFFIINATAIQFLPTTTIGLRTAAGSVSPYDTILPGIIATTLTAIFGVGLTLLIQRVFLKKRVKETPSKLSTK